MAKYYCPYCSPKYQFSRIDNSGKFFCGICGEYLVKKNFITFKLLLAIITIISIIFPILYLLSFSIYNYKNQNKDNYPISEKFLIK